MCNYIDGEVGSTILFFAEPNIGCMNLNVVVVDGSAQIQPMYANLYSIVANGNCSVSATGEYKKYTITYNKLRGGINPNKETTFTANDEIRLLPPSWNAYNKSCWVNMNDEIITTIPKGSDNDLTLFAKYEDPVHFTITYNLKDGNGVNPSVNPNTYTVEDNVNIVAPTCPGYRNGTWNGVTKWNKDERYENIVLEAIWSEPLTFNVKLSAIGAMTLIIPVTYNQPMPDNVDIPKREDGYLFQGFFYANTGKCYYDRNMKSMSKYDIPSDSELYAKWEKDPTWQPEIYYFVIDKINYRAATSGGSGAIEISHMGLEYDDEYTYTADDTLDWYNSSSGERDIRGFTCWRMILNGPDHYNGQTNPWIEFSNDKTISFKAGDIIKNYYPRYQHTDTIYIRAIYNEVIDDSCITTGTLITLADGTHKPVEQLTGDEQLLVWNLYTGRYDVAPILFIDHDPLQLYSVIKLHFSDNTVVNVIAEHGFFDTTLNKYVYLDKNAEQYVGHWFVRQAYSTSGEFVYTTVQLMSVIIEHEITEAWSPVTYGHLCYYVNDMLSMPGGISGLFNIFEMNVDEMIYDKFSMEYDIQTYGLYTYNEFAELIPVPQEMFDAVNGKYLKVAIGKGLITEERVKYLIERYIHHFAV